MKGFEELLKDKMEGANYEYKSKYWSAFKRHSGMPMLGKGAWMALSTVGAAFIVAGGLFFGLRNHESIDTDKVQNNESSYNNAPDNQTIAIDSSETNVISNSTDAPIISKTTQDKSAQKAVKSAQTTKVDTQAIAPKSNIEKAKHQKTPVFVSGRATVITIDSTESNDFPDYKTSTEPLP